MEVTLTILTVCRQEEKLECLAHKKLLHSNETHDEAVLSTCKPWDLNSNNLIPNHHFNGITSMVLNGNIYNELSILHNIWVQLTVM